MLVEKPMEKTWKTVKTLVNLHLPSPRLLDKELILEVRGTELQRRRAKSLACGAVSPRRSWPRVGPCEYAVWTCSNHQHWSLGEGHDHLLGEDSMSFVSKTRLHTFCVVAITFFCAFTLALPPLSLTTYAHGDVLKTGWVSKACQLLGFLVPVGWWFLGFCSMLGSWSRTGSFAMPQKRCRFL